MSSRPPCSHSRLHHSHPTLDVTTQDETIQVVGTFKGFFVHATFLLDWHGVSPVDWSVRGADGHCCLEVNGLLEDLTIEVGSLLLTKD